MAVPIKDIAATLQAELAEDERKAVMLQAQLAEVNQRIAANRAWLNTRGFPLSVAEARSVGKSNGTTHPEEPVLELVATESAAATDKPQTIRDAAAQILRERGQPVSMTELARLVARRKPGSHRNSVDVAMRNNDDLFVLGKEKGRLIVSLRH